MWQQLSTTLAACLMLISLADAQASNSLETQLRDAYSGKLLFLRGYYGGDTLSYGPDVTLTPAQDSGDWTVDGIVRIKNLALAGDKLTIDADRAGVGWSMPGFGPIFEPPSNDPKIVPRTAHIEVKLASELKDLPEAQALLSKIFLGDEDSVADTAATYWRPCLQWGSSGKFSQVYYRCRLSPDLLAIPGFKTHGSSMTPGWGMIADEPSASRPVYYVNKEIVPPHAESAPDPEYTTAARRAKYSGTSFVSFILDTDGKVQDLQITSPVGYGLDTKAIDAVQKWTFTPAKKGGEPVAVHLVVEVQFKLY